MKVYLAGNLESNWQDLVMRVKGPKYLDPRTTIEITNEHLYTPLEMDMIALSDVVIVYCDGTSSNRLVEMGYAVGIGKMVVLIDGGDAPPMASVMADELFAGSDPMGDFMKWWEEFVGTGEKVWQRYSSD